MARCFTALLLLLSVSGCAGYIAPPTAASPCTTEGEASWNCQIERYNRVSG